ncbi:polysaccharide lyase family 14 protein [Amylocystis lapponica]|nr:polysaccharide lyase family 14 protein [Amylocystis lapponica]
MLARMSTDLLLLYALLFCSNPAVAQIVSPTALASQYSLTSSTSLPFPSATLSSDDTQSFLVSSWSLSNGKIEDGASELAFVADPFPSPSSSSASSAQTSALPVLQVTYPAGSYSHNTGGAQFYSRWNASGAPFASVLLSYEVAFDADWDWVKGGKLPGLRGGPDVNGYDGGDPANGTDCFSARLMWRTGGAGEVYAYFLEPNGLCADSDFTCNSDQFGTSIDRGAFSFVSGEWNRVTLLVRLNDPDNEANGQVSLYYNNVQALNEANLQYRSSAAVDIGGLYFSTFFGGDDSSWATPQTVHSYFRNFEMWGSTAPSNLTGETVSNAAFRFGTSTTYIWLGSVLASVGY